MSFNVKSGKIQENPGKIKLPKMISGSFVYLADWLVRWFSCLVCGLLLFCWLVWLLRLIAAHGVAAIETTSFWADGK